MFGEGEIEMNVFHSCVIFSAYNFWMGEAEISIKNKEYQ
jgi:hypothetical protein